MRTGNVSRNPAGNQQNDEIDLRSLGGALWRNRFKIVIPALFVAVAALFIVGRMTPLYQSEARILIEISDNIYTRPAGAEREQREVIDEQAIQSQVQLVLSRSVALGVIEKAGLMQRREFDPLAGGMSVPKWFLTIFGLVRDPRRMTAEERVLDTYYQSLTVYPIGRSRVIVTQFSSSDPALAAKIANLVAEEYLRLQQSNKQDNTRDASAWLGREIEELRKRVAEAEGKVETFRAQSNLFLGANNATISTQQLGELNTQLTTARGLLAEAQAKSQLIRNLLKGNGAVESLDIANSELIRRLAEQRVMLRTTLAREGRTLLPAHPRMKELTAQLANLDDQIRQEGQVLARAFENEAKVAASRVETLQKSIDAQKKVASVANEQDVQLRALEREAKAQRDLLEQFLIRYREASSRESPDSLPPDARIISRASESNTPYFPKPIPIVVLSFFGMMIFAMALVVAAELLTVPVRHDAPPSPPVPPRPYTPDDDYEPSSPRGGRRVAPEAPSGQRSSYRAHSERDPVLARLDEMIAEPPRQQHVAPEPESPVFQPEPAPYQEPKYRAPERTVAPRVHIETPAKQDMPQPSGKQKRATPSHEIAPVVSVSFLDSDTPSTSKPKPLPEKLVGAKSAVAVSKDTAMRKIYGVQAAAQAVVKSVQQELRLSKPVVEEEIPYDETSMLERLDRIAAKQGQEQTPTWGVKEIHPHISAEAESEEVAPEVENTVSDTSVAVDTAGDEPAPVDAVAESIPEARIEDIPSEAIEEIPDEAISEEKSEAAAPVTHATPPSLDESDMSAFEKLKTDLMARLSSQDYAPATATEQETVHVPPVSGELPVFGKLQAGSALPTSKHEHDIEAADARLVDELAQRLADMPRGMEALSILVVGAEDSVDSGSVALKLARALSRADRKTVLLDSGSGNADILAAIPESAPVGLSDLIEDKVNFSQAIHRDQASPAHLIPAGNAHPDITKKLSGMEVMFGALGFTYDFIVVAGASCENEKQIRFMASRCAAAILVSSGRSGDPKTVAAHDMLVRNGLNDVVVLLSQTPATSSMSRLPASTGPRRQA